MLGWADPKAPTRRKVTAVLATLALMVSAVTGATLGQVAAAPAASAAPGDAGPAITLVKSGPGSILAGETASYRLAVSNPGPPNADPAYNVSFRDQLAPGVAYVPGSTVPADAGEPTVTTVKPNPVDATTWYIVLVWSNVFDVQPGGDGDIRFQVRPDSVRFPVGSSFTDTASAYANSDPRVLPKFDASGSAIPASYTASASDSRTTDVSAITITKSEPSSESELVRGVHDNSTVYTLDVRNTGVAGTDSVTVTDYIPAGLEFLACGGVDNTPPAGSPSPEYVGAPTLAVVPAAPAPCPAPTSVTTVPLAAGEAGPGSPAGVYTRVIWSFATLAAGSTTTIHYRAGIPLYANTTTFPSGTPSPASGQQGANLSNNTGASTRETGTALSLTNYADVAGAYSGPVQGGGQAVVARTQHTVTSEDLALAKTVAPTTFTAGGIATYTLTLRTGEYRQATGTVLTDSLPNGLCPLSSTTNFTATGAQPVSAECAPVADSDPTIVLAPGGGAPSPWGFTTVVPQADGTFDITFDTVPTIPANSVVTVTFKARMRSTYPSNGRPTALGDSFTNTVALQGDSAALPGPNPPDPAADITVSDSSSARLSSTGMSIAKQIAKDRSVIDCVGAPASDFFKPVAGSLPRFRIGDRVCFELRVDFSTSNFTRNPTVTDFLPAGTAYESWALGPGNTVPSGQVVFSASPVPSFALGAQTDGPSGPRYVDPGEVLVVRLAARVESQDSSTIDVTGNVMKYRSENSSGAAISLRDQVDLELAPTPPMSLTKAASSASVLAGQQVTYTVTGTNDGDPLDGSAFPVSDVEIWDVLPSGPPSISCAEVSSISGGGSCDTVTRTVRWTVAGPIDAGSSTPALSYVVTVPTTIAAGASLTNSAGVRTYTTATNTGGTVTHRPASNIDPTVCGLDPLPPCDVPAAGDTETVTAPGVTLAKTGTTSITFPVGNTNLTTGNNTVNRATVGELVTYTVRATVTAKTSVFDGVLTDTLPTGLAYQATPTAAAIERSTDGGTTFSPYALGSISTTASSVVYSLPASYTDASAATSNHVFRLTFTAKVTTLAGNTNGTARTNTATFDGNAAPGGASLPDPTPATYGVTIVEPSPSLTKGRTPATGEVSPGAPLTFTLTASNASGRAPLGDGFVIDCVPAGLVFSAYGATTPVGIATEAAVAGDGTNGCAATATRLAWNVGQLAGGASVSLPYTVTVAATAVGGARYTNSASLTGGTLQDGSTTPNPDERTYTRSASFNTDVVGGTVAKVVKPATTTTPTIGERVTYVVTATIPANVTLYQASLIDTLPRGLDPATVSLVGSIGCSPSCTVTSTALTPAASGANTKIGWLLGTLASSADARTVTAEYTVAVADLAGPPLFPVAGTSLDNSAVISWNLTDLTAPTSAGATFNRTSTPAATARVTVTEPSVTIGKTVSAASPAPGDIFGYSITATAASGATRSTAYGVVITDTVPLGVVVDAATISGSGVLTGAGANGGGTITWPGATIAPGASVTYTYSARLAPSASLTAAAKTNTARVTGYTSLPAGAGRSYVGPNDSRSVTQSLPHVVVAKSTPSGSLAYVGTPLTWRVTVTSDGGARAYGVDIVDTLPPNWTYTATTAVVVDGTTVTPAPEPVVSTVGSVQTLTWTDLADLDPTKTAAVTFTATPTVAATATPGAGTSVPHTNTATVTAADATGATASAAGSYAGPAATASAVIASADLALTKMHTGPVVAGRSFTWTLATTNLGNDTAVGPFTVTDTVAAGTTALSATGTGWTCGLNGNDVSCQRTTAADTLASGASFPDIVITVMVPSDTAAGASISNAATITGRTFDPVPLNNTGTDQVTVTASADLAITKARSGSLVAGQDLTYTLDVSNLGPSTSRSPITVADTLPAGTTFVSATGVDWACVLDTGTVRCTRATDLAAGAPAPQLTLTVKVAASLLASLSNTATVTGPTPDPDTDNNSSTSTGAVSASADLAIVKTHTGDFVPGTATSSYTFAVSNLGPSDAAADVAVTDTLPESLSFTGTATDVTGAWTCAATPASAPTPPTRQSLRCVLTGSLAAGGTAEVRVGIAVDVNAAASGSFVNTATVESPTPDPVPGNNSSTDTTGYDSSADLVLTKSPATQAVTAGQSATWTLTVANAGPSNGEGPTTVVDTLPSGMSFDSAAGAGWSCGAVVREITCTSAAGVVAGGSLPAITVVATVAPSAGPATLTNSATVTGSTPDPVPSNNTGTATATVTDLADLSIVKTHTGSSPVVAGTSTTFSLGVANAGPSDADDAVVTDTLPAGLVPTAVSGSGWSCGIVAVTVTCTRATLAAGATSTISVTALASASAPAGDVSNTATIASATADPDPGDNSSTAVVPVVTSADLSLLKSHAGTVISGGTVTFSLTVANSGPSDAQAPATVTDTLPAGLTYLSSGGGWSCSTSGTPAVDQVVTCTLGEVIPAGTSAPPLTLEVAVAALTTSVPLTNVAVVGSPTPDPDPTNNTGSDTFDVDTYADLAITKTHSGTVTVTKQKAFVLTVRNLGPAPAAGAVVTDTLPTGLAYTGYSGAGWACTAKGKLVTCRYADTLAAGASAAALVIRVRATAPRVASVVNTASVGSDNPDPDPSNNTATDRLVVTKLPQQPAKPVVVRTTPGGITIIAGRTNAGRPIAVTIGCVPSIRTGSLLAPRGELSYCRVIRTSSGVRIVTNGPYPVLVRVTFTAPATVNYTAFRLVRIYVIRQPR
mgnify:CR=1 FL=1